MVPISCIYSIVHTSRNLQYNKFEHSHQRDLSVVLGRAKCFDDSSCRDFIYTVVPNPCYVGCNPNFKYVANGNFKSYYQVKYAILAKARCVYVQADIPLIAVQMRNWFYQLAWRRPVFEND